MNSESTVVPASSGGSQSLTQNPQQGATAPSLTNGTQATSLQPGTVANSLQSSSGSGGIPLGAGGSSGLATASTQSAPKPAPHHVNAGLLGLTAALLVVAVLLVLAFSSAAKNTTNY